MGKSDPFARGNGFLQAWQQHLRGLQVQATGNSGTGVLAPEQQREKNLPTEALKTAWMQDYRTASL